MCDEIQTKNYHVLIKISSKTKTNKKNKKLQINLILNKNELKDKLLY